jgi:hypothetical protein
MTVTVVGVTVSRETAALHGHLLTVERDVRQEPKRDASFDDIGVLFWPPLSVT